MMDGRPDDTIARLTPALADRYHIERELGGGGMSRVFVADETALGRKVVVKVVAPELMEGVSAERFTREVKLAARLQQANIVPVFSAGEAAGIPYYTMPFVDGLSLRARLKQGVVPLSEAVGILRDIARALAYAHAQGVVHRDIKPENILLSGGAAVVTDFGIAKALSASRTQDVSVTGSTSAGLTRAGMSLGTPAYMAPEQALGDPSADHRADIYAWGIVAWEMIAGVHPFSASRTAHAMIAAHVSDTPARLDSKRAEVPVALAALVMRCLEKTPANRPASASDVLDGLDTASVRPSRGLLSRNRAGRFVAVGAIVIVAMGAAWFARSLRTDPTATAVANTTSEKSLAVLPFTSVGGDTANAYFAEGIADELTTALARLPGLRLAGRSSVTRLKGRGADAPQIGSALKVNAVLDGTVRRAGDRIRVSAELSSTADGHLIWKESYERELKDVFAVQDDITKSIVAALQVQLAGGSAAPSISSHGTKDLQAYDLYLRGLQLFRRRGRDLIGAERYLTQAIERDPRYAQAHAMLASVIMVKPYYFDTSVSAVLPRARAAAQRAAALDDALPYAHAALGHVHTEAFEWNDAERELRRAIALDPNNAEIAYRLGFMLLESGRIRESIVAFERSKTLDPLYSAASVYLAWSLAFAGRNAEAVGEARRAHDMDSTSEVVNSVYANVLLVTGHVDEAIAQARAMVPRTTNLRRLSYYGLILGKAGAIDDARRLLRLIESTPEETPGRNSSLTYLYVGIGDTARALDALTRATATDGDLILGQIMSSSYFDSIRASPRFAAAMRRLNLDVSRLTAPDGGRSR